MTSDGRSSSSERAQRFFDSVPEPDGLLDDVVDDAIFEGARTLDPSLGRVSELRLRLAGPHVVDGFYDPAVEEALAGPLGRELAAAGDQKIPQTRLGLVGISAGSVVLHYRPHVPLLTSSVNQSDIEVTPADAAVRRVLRLHDLFESQAPAAQIAASAGNNNALLRGARGVVEALVNFDLSLSATWWSPTGQPIRSSLTERGRTHAAAIFRREEKEEQVPIWGLVSALDVDGIVTVRQQSQRHRIRVDEDRVQDFELGERVHLLVTSTTLVDRVGLRGRHDYTLVRRLEVDDHLDWSSL